MGEINVWDINLGKCLNIYVTNMSSTFTLALPQTKIIILGSSNGQIKLFDLSNGQMMKKTFKSRHHQDFVHSLLLIQSNNELVSGTSDECAPHILSLKTEQCLKRLVCF